MFAESSKHALKAMIYLAQHADDQPITGARIAAQTAAPRKYLSKILADLVRAGALTASPGKTGGFRLARPADQIRLLDVLASFEPVLNGGASCPFGHEVCGDGHPCGGHERWKRVNELVFEFLRETSVQDVAADRRGGCGTM